MLGLNENETLTEKSKENETIEMDDKELDVLSSDGLFNLGVYYDVADERFREFSETSSQKKEKTKEFFVSEEENDQLEKVDEVLSKSGENFGSDIKKMKVNCQKC